MNISECNFESNKATSNGNAIFNKYEEVSSSRIVHFNRFYDTATGYEIYSASGAVDAKYNWWGSNGNPSSKVSSNVTVTPWLILKITANPTILRNGTTSQIIADLRYDSNGTYHNPANGYIPNDLSVTFTITKGTITTNALTKNGIATTALKAGTDNGTATLSAKLDNQTLTKNITIDNTPPTIQALIQ